MEFVKKIDVHAHTTMWDKALLQPGVTMATPSELRESFAKMGVDKAFFLPLISPEHRFCLQTNEEAEYVANQNADLFYWFCNVDPRMGRNRADSDLSKILGEYKRRGAIGVGEVTANLYTDDPLMENFFYHCAECDLPVTVHMTAYASGSYGIIDDMGLPRLEKMLKKYPKLRILGHSACFWCEISRDVTEDMREGYPKGKVSPGRVVELLREYPNLYCDLSAGGGFNAISRDEEFGYRFIEEFSDRLMYGADLSVAGQMSPLVGWLDEGYAKGCISYENYKKVCRGNAIRVFGLDIE